MTEPTVPRPDGLPPERDTAGAEAAPPLACAGTLHGLFARQAARTPQREALVAGAERLTYAELDARANRLAQRLRRLGVGLEERIAVRLERGADLVVALLAALKAGGAYVPIDPAYPAERQGFMLADSGATVLLTDAPGEHPGFAGRTVRVGEEAGPEPPEDGEAPPPLAAPENLAYVIYTSGSTGVPKGTAIEHRAARALIDWAAEVFTPEELSGVLAATSVCFDLSIFEIFFPLAVGGRIFVARDALALPELPAAHEVRLINTVPSAVAELLRAGAIPPSVRTVNLAGEPLRRSLVDRIYALPHVDKVYNLYGPTEDTTYSTWALVPCGVPDPPSIGRPIRGTRAHLLDAGLDPVADGTPGELYLAGEGLARAYLGRPDVTAQRFTPDPFSPRPGQRMYATGDLVRYEPSGELGYIGRIDHQVKIRGFRIEPGEVQAKLEGCPGVAEAVVLAREVGGSGEGDVAEKALVAYLRPAAGATLARPALRAFAAAHLPAHMVPAHFVVLDAFPLTPNGKVDRAALPAPEDVREEGIDDAGFEAPEGELEERLARAWCEVLGLRRVGRREDFFVLGGHSLAAARVRVRLREGLGVELAPRAFLEHPTIEGQARLLAAMAAAPHAAPLEGGPEPPAGWAEPSAPGGIAAGEALSEPALTVSQEALWVADRVRAEQPLFTIAYAVDLAGALDLGALRRAFAQAVLLHADLGLVFEEREGRPVPRRIAPATGLPLVDLRALPVEAARRFADGLEGEAARTRIDVQHGPLLQAQLILLPALDAPAPAEPDPAQAAPTAHGPVRRDLPRSAPAAPAPPPILPGASFRLLVLVHHLVFDDWSAQTWFGDLAALYERERGASPAPSLPAADPGASAFARWQRRWLEGPAGRAELGFWRAYLEGAPRRFDLPFDRPRPALQAMTGAVRVLRLQPALLDAVAAQAREAGTTTFTGLLALYAALLQRWTGAGDFLVSTPFANRERRGVDRVVSLFTNALPVRFQPDPEAPFAGFLAAVREGFLRLLDHQEYPAEQLLRDLGVEPAASHPPLAQVGIVFQDAPVLPLHLGDGVAVRARELAGGAARLDLLLYVRLESGGADLVWEYDRALFDGATVARLSLALEALAQAATARPDAPLAALRLLRQAEEHQLVHAWNDSADETGLAGPPVHEAFAALARRSPQTLALRMGERERTYGELEEAAGRLAWRLRAEGVGPETLVAVALEPSLEMPLALLAVLKAGGAYLPLDPSYPAERLEWMLADSGARLVLTVSALAPRLPPFTGRLLELDGAFESRRPEDRSLFVPVERDHLAYVIYTSGSTGRPKGVQLSHRGLVNLVAAQIELFALAPGKRQLQFASFSFDASVSEIFTALVAGAALVFGDRSDLLPGEPLAALLRAQGVTTLTLPPSALAALDAVDPGGAGLPALDTLVVAGEACPRELAERWASGRRFLNAYGPTEGTVCASAAVGVPPGAGLPIGRPIANFRMLVLDRQLEPCPSGVPGEIVLAGIGLARGYLGRPDLTAERFLPAVRPVTPGERMYRTGDLGRTLADGRFDYLGRIDRQVKVRGFRIELGEVEAALNALPAVREAVVGVREGRSGPQLVGYWVPASEALVEEAGDAGPAPAELRRALLERLPEYMVPAAFLRLPAFPLTPNGKVDRKALAALAPEEGSEAAAGQAPPQGPIEEVLAALWCGLLGLDRVGRHAGFFDLGGHSLLATQVLARLRKAFGVTLAYRTFFAAPTIAGLAERVEAALREGRAEEELPPIVRAPEDLSSATLGDLSSAAPGDLPSASPGNVPFPLSHAQRRLWHLYRLDSDSPAYNIPDRIGFRGALDVPALAAALAALARRHESLRTHFAETEGEARQRIDEAASLPLARIDLDALPVEARSAEADRLAREEAARPFDLVAGPVARATLLLLRGGDEGEHQLLLSVHHIVSDGWSQGLLLSDLASLYSRALNAVPASRTQQASSVPEAQPSELEPHASKPPASRAPEAPSAPRQRRAIDGASASPGGALPLRYVDFALWQQRHWSDAYLERQAAYWRRRLRGVPDLLDLPLDRLRPPVWSGRGHRVAVRLCATRPLRAAAHRAGVTPYLYLLAAFEVLLHRLSHQETVAVGSPAAGRGREELERIVGFFVNTLVLRADLEPAMPFTALLEQARGRMLEAHENQDLPFDRLVEALNPERSPAHTPLFQVLFSFQRVPFAPRFPAGLAAEPLAIEGETAKFDLQLAVEEGEEGVEGWIEYATDLFDRTTVLRWSGHLGRLLEAVLGDPELAVDRIPLLGAAEVAQLRSEWNAEGWVAWPPGLLHAGFERSAARDPGAVALRARGRAWTYGELERDSRRLAAELARLGAGPEAPVAVLLERSGDLVAALLAVLRAGGAYLPLDPAYPEERLRFMVADAGARLVLTTSALWARLGPALSSASLEAQPLFLDEGWEGALPETEAPALDGAGGSTALPGHLAYFIYTSGSTGRPKGVAIEHRSASALVGWALGAFSRAELAGVLAATSVCFDLSVFEIFVPLAAGGAVVLADHALHLATLPEAGQVTLVNTVPSAMAELVRAGALPPSVRIVNLAGEPLPARLAAEVYAVPGVERLYNLYGPSEDTTYSTWGLVERHGGRAPSIGRPLPGSAVHLLDRELAPVPIGVPGALYLGGQGLARGYLGRPELTADRFLPDPFAAAPGGRLYATGDLARYRVDGEIEFLGRLDHQVKVRGFRIELGEIEAALATHPAVREAVVVARPRKGTEGDLHLVAYVAPAPGTEVTVGELREHLGRRLPSSMLPGAWVMMPALPLTPNGKVDRKALPEPADAQEGAASIPAGSAVSVRSPTEELVAAIWAEVLERGDEPLHPEAGFFELGGHSLLAARVLARVRSALGVDLPLRSLFEAPALGAFARRVAAAAAGAEASADAGGGGARLRVEPAPRGDERSATATVDVQEQALLDVAEAPASVDAGRPASRGAGAIEMHTVRVAGAVEALTAPASLFQRGLWFLDQLAPGLPVYNLPTPLRLDGPLDPARLGAALRTLVARHEALRTTFVVEAGEPQQRIAPAPQAASAWTAPTLVAGGGERRLLSPAKGAPIERVTTPEAGAREAAIPSPAEAAPTELPLVDLAALPSVQRNSEAQRLVAAESLRPFDLERGPLQRATLFRLAPDEHRLLLVQHHVVSDAWTVDLLLRELGALYAGAPLPPVPLQYADFAFAQRRWISGAAFASEVDFWRRRLAGAPSALDLPTDRPRPARPSHRGALDRIELGPLLAADLARLARREVATVPMVVHAVLADLLGRLARQDDLTFGSAVANRGQEELERVAGYFVNTVVLRLDRGGDPAFRTLLAAARESALASYSHPDLPFELLVEELRPERDPSRIPYCQVMFNAGRPAAPAPFAPGVLGTPLALDLGIAKFDLTFTLEVGEGALAVTLESSSDLYDRTTARRLLAHLAGLLESAVAAPERRLSELAYLSAAERHQVEAEWSDTRRALPQPSTIPALVTEAARRRPEAVALVQGEREVSYAELEHRAGLLAVRLRHVGVGPEILVAVALERSIDLIVALLAVLKAGGAFVPFDTSYPEERLAWLLADAAAPVLLADERSLVLLPSAALAAMQVVRTDLGSSRMDATGGVPGGTERIATDPRRAIDPAASGDEGGGGIAPADLDLPVQIGPDSLAYVMYTSGTTGRPKGVAVPHRAVVRLVRETGYARFGPEETFLLLAPTSFDASTLEVWGALANGARLAIYSEAKPGLEELGEAIARHRVTFLWLTAGLFHSMADHNLAGLAGVRQLYTGGDVVSAAHARRALAAHPGLTLTNGYGPTENTTFTTCQPLHGPEEVTDPLPIGRPIANSRAVLLDPDLAPVPAGVPGELYCGGEGLARGYLCRPELTAERFVPDPAAGRSAEPGARLYRTGDLARFLPDGRIEFLGRIDGQVKIRGFRIEPEEIESALLEHPGVARAVVVARPFAAGGRKDKRLVAYVVPRGSSTVDAAALRTYLDPHLRQRLPEFMIPAAWVPLAELPLDPNGKVARKALPEPGREAEPGLHAEAGLADGAALDALGEGFSGRHAAPAPGEEILLGLWADALGVARVGRHEGFFDLGGHSLLATQLISRVREAFGVPVPLRQLFETPTVAGFAVQLEEALAASLSSARRGAEGGEKGAGAAPEAPPAVPPITPSAEPGPLPLSYSQSRLWFLEQLTPQGAVYNIPYPLTIDGDLDPAHARAALRELVRRHHSLRTTFAEIDGEPRQLVAPAGAFDLPLVDLAALPASVRRAEGERLAEEDAAQPFDLGTDPLFRARLVRLGDEAASAASSGSPSGEAEMGEARDAAPRWLLPLSMHHIVSDGWSVDLLLREWAALYAASVARLPSPLAGPTLQYGDFAVWQRRWQGPEALAEPLAYWRRQLAGAPSGLDLPADRPRPRVQTFHGGSTDLRLSAAEGERLRAACRREGVTLFMLLLAAFDLVLARSAHQEDVPVGTPIANRTRRETEGLVGFFVNTLVLRVDASGDPTFRQLLRRVRETALGAYAHQELPFEQLVEELRPARDLSRSPFFQVFFSLRRAGRELPSPPGLRVAELGLPSRVAKFDLSLAAVDEGEEVWLGVEYNRDLFDAATARRLLERVRRAVLAGAERPELRLGDVPLLGAAERSLLLRERNAPEPPAEEGEATLVDLLDAQAARTPDALALVVGEERLTYAELSARAERLARRLRRLGAGPERLVGVLLDREAELVVALLAVLRAGSAYVPIDPAYPAPRVHALLRGSRAGLLVTRRALAARHAEALPQGLRVVSLDGPEPKWEGGPKREPSEEAEEPPAAPARAANLAYVIYTSGSTGEPKGVAIDHRAAVAFVRWARDAFSVAERAGVLASTSVCFDLSVFELFATLAWGGTVLLAENALALPTLPAASQVTLINTVPSAMTELVHQGAVPPGVRTVNLAGEPLPGALVERIYAGTRVERVHNLYGPSEDTTYSTWTRVPRGDARPPSIGRPLAGTQAYLLDAGLEPVPLGVAGALYLAGLGLARGYLGRPDLTAERFLPDPFAAAGKAGGRLYKTGDLARFRSDGELEFLGRIDHQVKVRGFRIELGEIEAALLRHPGIGECAVLALSEPGEEGGLRLAAFVVPRDTEGAPETGLPADGTLTNEALRSFLHASLPAYMVPSAFAVLEALPLTPNGKVDRRALAALAPAPEAAPAGAAERPATPLEEVVAGVWSDLFGGRPVGREDRFFDLGGHSLLAARVVSRLRATLGVELPVQKLFELPTVAGLAAFLEGELRRGTAPLLPPIRPVPRDAPLPLSFAQQRLWFVDRLDPGNPVFNLPAPLRLRGPLGPEGEEVLVRALAEIVRRHEPLRTVFAEVAGRAVQRILPPAPLVLERVDLSGLPLDVREAAASRAAEEEARRPFDLERSGPARFSLLRLGPEDHLLLATLHHVAGDAWSLDLFRAELAGLYAAFRRGEPSPLPELAVQYADYAAWQRQVFEPQALPPLLAAWRERFGGDVPRLDLPTDRPRPLEQTFGGGYRGVELGPELGAQVRAFARPRGVTVFMTLLAAFEALLGRLSGQERMLLGSPVAGRNRAEVEGMIGCFVNTLVLPGDLRGDPPFAELVERVRGAALAAYACAELPFEKLVEALQPERDRSRSALFQVMFSFQAAPSPAGDDAPVGLHIEPYPVGTGTSQFDLTLFVAEGEEGGLFAGIEYNLDLWDAATVDGMLAGYRELLAAALAAPEVSLSALAPAVQPRPAQPAPPPAPVVERVVPSRPQAEERRDRLAERRAKLSGAQRDAFQERLRSLKAQAAGGASSEAPAPERPGTCRVEITPLAGSSRHPFFAVHPAGGDVLCFFPLARALGAGQPFVAFQARGLESDAPPPATLEAMAADYCAELRAVQPEGPYCLGGWSFGGLVAFEMARQLETAGERVELLAVLDTGPGVGEPGMAQPGMSEASPAEPGVAELQISEPAEPPGDPADPADEDDTPWLLSIAEYVKGLRGLDLGVKREDLLPLDNAGRLDLFVERLRRAGVFHSSGDSLLQLRRLLRVYKTGVRLYQGYRPRPYGGALTLVRGRSAAFDPALGEDLGWGAFAARVEVEWVPGDHITMLAEGQVGELAARLRALLDAPADASAPPAGSPPSSPSPSSSPSSTSLPPGHAS